MTTTIDSPTKAVVNALGAAVFVVALVVAYRQRTTHGVNWGVLAGIVINGVGVPLGAAVFLLARATWARHPTRRVPALHEPQQHQPTT